MIRLLILLLALASPLRAEDLPALHAVTGVAANDVLNIRERPDAGSPIIGTLAPDATGVEVIATSGAWALVNTDEGSGYAALRYLAREPGPAWSALQTPITCIGTEPFWSLEIDPQAGETRYRTPEGEGPRVAPLATVWPGLPWAPSAAVGLEEGLAVMQPQECSDGMSDRRYGIAVDIFRSGPGGAERLSGCCSLGLR